METHPGTLPTNSTKLNNNYDVKSIRDITMQTERDFSKEGAQLFDDTNYAVKGLDPLKQRDELQRKVSEKLAKGFEIDSELNNELNNTIQEIQKERNPLLASSDKADQTIGRMLMNEANILAHSKNPKSFLNSRIDDAIERGEKEFLSYMYDWYESTKPEDKNELEFNHSQMDKIMKYFKANTKVYDLYSRKHDLKRQKNSLKQYIEGVNKIAELGYIDTMSKWKNALSNGELR